MSDNKSAFIKNCFEDYERRFSAEWLEAKYKWDTIENAIASSTKIKREIADFARYCFVNTTKSLLQGEYILNRRLIETTKKSFEKYWGKEHLCPTKDNEGKDIRQLRRDSYKAYELLDSYLKSLFATYDNFITSVEEKMDFSNHQYLFKLETAESRLIKDFNYFIILRELIIPICETEHYLEFSNNMRDRVAVYIEQLHLLHKKEDDPDCKKVLALAIHKGNFILRKLLRPRDTFEILVNNEKKILSRENLILPESLAHYFACYENIHENAPYIESDIKTYLFNISRRQSAFLEMALIMNHYCASGSSKEQVDNLLKLFETTYHKFYQKKFHYRFDNHSLNTLRNYMYNCRLSFLTKRQDFTIDELQDEITKIEGVHSETFVNNFYPYKKAIEFLIDTIQRRLKDRDLSFDYNASISLLSKYLKRFDDNIHWCENHKFYPIQLPVNDCIVRIDDVDVIFPSSVTRPIDYARLKEDQKNYILSLNNLNTALIALKDKKELEAVKIEIKNIEKRYLEIGGILIGVVTFLLGTINILTNSSANIGMLFRTVLGLGIVLILFGIVFALILENYWNDSTNKKRIIICSVLLVVYTSIVIWLAVSPNYFPADDTTITESNQAPSP